MHLAHTYFVFSKDILRNKKICISKVDVRTIGLLTAIWYTCPIIPKICQDVLINSKFTIKGPTEITSAWISLQFYTAVPQTRFAYLFWADLMSVQSAFVRCCHLVRFRFPESWLVVPHFLVRILRNLKNIYMETHLFSLIKNRSIEVKQVLL